MRMIALTAVALALTVTSAGAQDAGDGAAGGMGPGGFGGRHHGQHQKKADAQAPKPKVDEKAYSAALKELPDKPYDPWRGVH